MRRTRNLFYLCISLLQRNRKNRKTCKFIVLFIVVSESVRDMLTSIINHDWIITFRIAKHRRLSEFCWQNFSEFLNSHCINGGIKNTFCGYVLYIWAIDSSIGYIISNIYSNRLTILLENKLSHKNKGTTRLTVHIT